MTCSNSGTNHRSNHPYVTSNAVIQSTEEGASGFMDRLLRMLAHHRFSQEEVGRIQAAVQEALTNAIRHGNKSNPAKEIHAVFTLRPSEFSIRIQDQGEGFENIVEPGGRGLMLMRLLMHVVRFNAKGNIVTLIYRRDVPSPPPTSTLSEFEGHLRGE